MSTVMGILTLPGREGDVARARRFVRSIIGDHCDGETAVLLTSELVTNSIIHGTGLITVVVMGVPSGIRIEVRDRGSEHLPQVRASSETAEGGRGLFLVDRLAMRWDHFRDSTGLTSWFELAAASPA